MVPHRNCILLGDFNFPDIYWQSLSSSHPISKQFCDFIFNNNFIQLVNSPTHSNGYCNILDLVLTNSTDLVFDVSVLSSESFPRMKSDHNFISFKIPSGILSKKKSLQSYTFNFSKGDYHLMNEHIISLDLSDYYNSLNIEHLWSTLKSRILECYHLYILKLTKKSTRYPKWFNSDLIHQSHHVKYLRKKKKANSSPTVHNVLTLQKAELRLANQTSSAKKLYEAQLIQDFAFRNSSPIFKYIHSFSKQASLPSVMFLDMDSETSSLGKANLFNKVFNSVFTPNSSPQKSIHTVNDMDDSISFEEEDVFQYLSLLDPAKAMGIDNIPNSVLKHCSRSLCSPIYHLFQQCVKQGYLPSEWRLHKIIPIYKLADKSSVKNYRPISLLCCISKVLESLVYDRIYDNISPHISTNQFGFLRQRSSVQQLLKFIISIHEAFNHKSQVDTVYFDIRKAFDSVSHGLLLDKLVDIGIYLSFSLEIYESIPSLPSTVCFC